MFHSLSTRYEQPVKIFFLNVSPGAGCPMDWGQAAVPKTERPESPVSGAPLLAFTFLFKTRYTGA
jgi:hypothetical protein